MKAKFVLPGMLVLEVLLRPARLPVLEEARAMLGFTRVALAWPLLLTERITVSTPPKDWLPGRGRNEALKFAALWIVTLL